MVWVPKGGLPCRRAEGQDGYADCCINYQPQKGGANEYSGPEITALVGVVGSNVPGACPLYQRVRQQGKWKGFCAGHEPPNQNAFYLKVCQQWPNPGGPDALDECPGCKDCFEWVP